MTDLAVERKEPWLDLYGGRVNAEWYFPKLLETLEKLSQGGTFLVVVRTDPTQLLNVLLDGKLLTEYHKDFEVIDENTGTFLLVFSEAVMQSLEAGEHTLTLDINGIGELVRTITVVK